MGRLRQKIYYLSVSATILLRVERKMNWKNEFQPEHLGIRLFITAVAAVVYLFSMYLAFKYGSDNFQPALAFLALGITAVQVGVSNMKISSPWKIGSSAVLTFIPAIIAILGAIF